MSRRAKIITAVVVVVIVLGAVGYFVLRSRSGGPTIDTAVVEQQDLSVKVQASGKVQAGTKADLYPPTAGTIDQVFVIDGQRVTAGQQIAIMDTAPLELQVSQAEAGVQQAQAQLTAVEQQAPSSQDIKAAQANVSASKSGVSAAKSGLSAAEAGLSSAEKAYDLAKQTTDALEKAVETSPTLAPDLAKARVAESQAQAAVAQAQAGVDQAAAAVKQADAGYKTAQAQLAKLQDSSTGDAEAAARASLQGAQDALAIAQANLAAATFVSPFDGVVFFNPTGTIGADGEIPKASAGSALSPASAPFSVVSMSGVIFTAEVDEADVDRVKTGMSGEIRLDAFPGETFSSRVIEVRSAAQQTATGGTIFPVDMSIENTDRILLIGMKGDCDISVSSIGSAMVIPVEALFDQNGQSYVYVVENGKLKKTDITTGAITDTTVQVLSGLEAGQVVALSGSVEYTDGMAVKTK